MASLLKILIVYLIVFLGTYNVARAQTPSETPPPSHQPLAINEFNNRLSRVFQQSNPNTPGQQIIYGTIEALAAYKLGSFVTALDKSSIKSLHTQLLALEDKRGTLSYGADSIPERERLAKIGVIKTKLKVLEGSITQRVGRGFTKILVRGSQVFLILQVASRFYILNALDSRDPGFFPLPSVFCSGIDCELVANEVIESSNEVYLSARRAKRDLSQNPSP